MAAAAAAAAASAAPTVAVFGSGDNSTSRDDAQSWTVFSDTENYSYYYDLPDEDFGRCVYYRHGATFLPTLYAVFFLLGIVGNSLVLWVISCGARLRSMTDVCLLNLAVADLLLVCSLPFLAHQAWDQWRFGDGMCKVVLGVYHIVLYCGIFFICLMSVDRYLAVVHAIFALRARTRTFGSAAAVMIWVTGFLASFPDLLFLQQQTSGNRTYCYPVYPTDTSGNTHFWRVLSLFKMNILGLVLPSAIIGFCYSQIIWVLVFSQTSKKQAIRLVVIVVVAFFGCWVPYNVASFFRALELLHVYTACESSKAIRLSLEVSEAVAYSHSCLNPILYVFVGEKFRRHLLRLISRTPCKLCQLMMVYLPQDRRTSTYSQTTSVDERSTAV